MRVWWRHGVGVLLLLVGGCVASAVPAADDVEAAAEAAVPVPAPAPTEVAPEAEPDCAHRVARAVQEHYEAVRDLEARFTQTRGAAALGGGTVQPAPPPSTGRVVLQKPGRMRWSYEAPEPSLLVTDGEIVWMYDPLLEEAQRLPDAGGFLSGAAVQFLMGQGDLVESFVVRAARCDASPVELDLEPRTDVGYERLAIRADPKTGEVHSTTVTDLFGNRTTVLFEDVQVNREPPAATFTFEPPEGVDVIDLTPPASP